MFNVLYERRAERDKRNLNQKNTYAHQLARKLVKWIKITRQESLSSVFRDSYLTEQSPGREYNICSLNYKLTLLTYNNSHFVDLEIWFLPGIKLMSLYRPSSPCSSEYPHKRSFSWHNKINIYLRITPQKSKCFVNDYSLWFTESRGESGH